MHGVSIFLATQCLMDKQTERKRERWRWREMKTTTLQGNSRAPFYTQSLSKAVWQSGCRRLRLASSIRCQWRSCPQNHSINRSDWGVCVCVCVCVCESPTHRHTHRAERERGREREINLLLSYKQTEIDCGAVGMCRGVGGGGEVREGVELVFHVTATEHTPVFPRPGPLPVPGANTLSFHQSHLHGYIYTQCAL